MRTLVSTLNVTVQRWRDENLRVVEPLDEASVVNALNQTEKRYSHDLVELYSVIGGLDDYDMDSRGFSFWPLPEVVTRNADYPKDDLLFADFLIQSHLYAFRYENEDTSSVWVDHFNGEEAEKVTSSVVEFFELIESDPDSIQLWLMDG